MNDANHWNKIYTSKPVDALGWYEEIPSPSIEFISKCNLNKTCPIIDVGSGASNLIQHLIIKGYRNLIALDHSTEAIRKLKESIPEDQVQSVRLIVADICSSEWLDDVDEVALWHDRALLHFLMEPSDREKYMDRLRYLVKKDGFVVIGAFSLEGASYCSGLPVQRYSAETLSKLIGDEFCLIESTDYLYRMPGGDTRHYVYAMFKRLLRK